jgi:hypothetical protein
LTNWALYGGIIVGFLIARYFIGPMFAKSLVPDVNTFLHNNPQLGPQLRSKLSPQELQQARQQGLNV